MGPASAGAGRAARAIARAMAEVISVEHLRSATSATGFKNVIKTTSRKFQARIFVKEHGGQRGLGTFATAEEAAAAVAKAMAGGPAWSEPPVQRARRDTVRLLTPNTRPPLRMF